MTVIPFSRPNVSEIEKPTDCRYVRSAMVQKLRDDMAAEYRTLRKTRPALARMLFRIDREMQENVGNYIRSLVPM